jgi:hypothetical protein
VEELRILEDLALALVIALRVDEALLEVVLHGLERGVLVAVEALLDLVERDGPLDDLVVVRVRALGREREEHVREDALSVWGAM